MPMRPPLRAEADASGITRFAAHDPAAMACMPESVQSLRPVVITHHGAVTWKLAMRQQRALLAWQCHRPASTTLRVW
jgi:hypothetical protein